MAKKSYRCSSFLSCFPCLNTQPAVDLCENNPRIADASAKAIPDACPEAQSSYSANAAAKSNASLAAATEGADERRHDLQTVTSASAPPFQAATSHDASSSSSFSVNVAADSNASLAAATEGADERRHGTQTFTSASAPPFQASTSHDVCSSSAEGASTSPVHYRTSRLPTAQELSLSSTKSIEGRPRISKLPILRVLQIDGCDSLKRLPEDFGSLGSLEELRLSSCKSIEELPRSITKLPILRVLKIDGCDGLKRLPEELGSLGSLQELILSSCKSIEELPESASELRFLKTLKMRACENLIHLPDNFESLESLQILELHQCRSLQVFPRNFVKFLKLEPFDDEVYDYLRESCKDPFLDVCLFFKGSNWDSFADIVGESELDLLEKRALVYKDSKMNVEVHEVILRIATKRVERTRFNFSKASSSQIEEFLKKDISHIKGLWLDEYKEYIPATKLDSMSESLKILRLGNVEVKGKCDKKFEKLVFFQGNVSHLPFNISQMPSGLKHMELDGKGHSNVFKIFPSDFRQLLNLRILRLVNFAGLEKLPEELGEVIEGLRELSLSYCTPIEELPTSILKLQYLRVLYMYHCYSLRRLPEDLGSLTFLQELAVSFCKHIEELPESTSNLQSLKRLKMRGCENLKRLPKEFESLDSLQVLELQYCDSLNVLPRNFEKFQKLKPFDGDVYASLPESLKDPFLDICLFFNGWNWDSVADIVGESELAELESKRAELEDKALVSKDSNMTVRVHDDILILCRKRAERTRFNFSNASTSQIEEFIKEDIPGIKGIWLDDDYKDPLYIPALKLNSMSDSLRILRFGNSVKMQGECDQRFDKLVYFQGKVSHLPFNISQMPSSLKHMELDGKGHSHVFKISLNDIQQLGNLRIMRLINFVGLKKLPEELGHILHELRELTLSHCTSMKEIPRSISKLQHLRILKMDCCYNLMRLPQDFGSLSSLQELTLSYCTSMKEVPRSISKLQHLRVLKMDCCYNLLRLPEDFGSLNSLEELTLSCCIQMEELPKLQNLRVLKADYCFNLKELPNSELLKSSRELFCKCHVKEKLPKSEPIASPRSESESESELIAKLQSESESESIAKLQSQPESESIAKIQSESESITELQSSKN